MTSLNLNIIVIDGVNTRKAHPPTKRASACVCVCVCCLGFNSLVWFPIYAKFCYNFICCCLLSTRYTAHDTNIIPFSMFLALSHFVAFIAVHPHIGEKDETLKKRRNVIGIFVYTMLLQLCFFPNKFIVVLIHGMRSIVNANSAYLLFIRSGA